MKESKDSTLRVGIQGVAGCFHDAAAREYFSGVPEVETIEFDTFPDLFEAVHFDASLIGIVAIENTIAGSILTNHELLRGGDQIGRASCRERVSINV